ncbi:MAG: gliding motility-associated C-terminal domain-containing protein [Spirochaetes bacterium]|nr:gliding motility-associated C-terminal domain-containing protein [Spirochaetota bacterium]
MRKLIIIFIILSFSLYLSADTIIDTRFSEITENNNVEYNGEVVKLDFSGVRPIEGNETSESVINFGSPAFAANSVGMPSVIKDGSMYRMWYFGESGVTYRIGYAYSYDGINWIKVTGPKTGGSVIDIGSPAFVSSDAYYPSIIKDGSLYKMWFSGQDGVSFRIGYAFSTNGIDWTVYSNASKTKGCVLDIGSPAFAKVSVSYHSVMKDGSLYKMWFTGIDDNSTNRIGYATSSDGIDWTVYSNSLKIKGCVIREGSPAFAATHVYSPSVIKDGFLYKMWFTGNNIILGKSIGYAISPDGISWTVQSNESHVGGSVFEPGYPDCALVSVESACVIKDGSSYKIWYTGNGGANLRIGYGLITVYPSGSFISSVINTGSPVDLEKLYYYGDVKAGTSIKFQVKGAKTISELGMVSFTGPKNRTDTYYDSMGETIDGMTNVQYIQYKACFSTTDDTYSPELSMVKFTTVSADIAIDDNASYVFPNPFHQGEEDLSIRYSLSKASEVEIKIYTPEGREVWDTSLSGNEGWNTVRWNGKDKSGNTAGSGTYLYVITKKYSEGDKTVKSIIMLVR